MLGGARTHTILRNHLVQSIVFHRIQQLFRFFLTEDITTDSIQLETHILITLVLTSTHAYCLYMYM